jgi:hypothetical protein
VPVAERLALATPEILLTRAGIEKRTNLEAESVERRLVPKRPRRMDCERSTLDADAKREEEVFDETVDEEADRTEDEDDEPPENLTFVTTPEETLPPQVCGVSHGGGEQHLCPVVADLSSEPEAIRVVKRRRTKTPSFRRNRGTVLAGEPFRHRKDSSMEATFGCTAVVLP